MYVSMYVYIHTLNESWRFIFQLEQPHSMYLAEDSNEGDGKYGKFNLKTISYVIFEVVIPVFTIVFACADRGRS